MVFPQPVIAVMGERSLTFMPTTILTAPYGTGDKALFKPLNDDDVKFYTGKVRN